jgi:hypothetical protein
VDAGKGAGLVGAAGERDFEFAAEALAIGVAQQEIGEGTGVRGNVEDFVAADAGDGASRDVAD